MAAALLLTSPFVPMLFQGEEWGASTPFQYFTDHPDPELGRTVSEGRRHEFAAFGWDPDDVPDPQDPATFERSRLDWAEPVKDCHAGPAGLVPPADQRCGGRFRRSPIPASTASRPNTTRTAGWLVVRRGPVAVAANLGGRTWTFPAGPAAELLAASDPGVERTGQGVVLPPDTVALVTEGLSHP